MKHYIIAALAAVLCFWQCTVEEDQPIVYDAPVAEFPAEIPSEISLNVGESYTFSVNFSEGEKLTKEWRVNDHLESSSDRLTYTFNEPGTFTVSFKAYNGTGSVSRSYTVVVGDKLVMHLSVGDSTVVSRLEESYLQLYAIVEHGEDVTYSWSVDGVKKCDKAYFDNFYIPKGAKTYKITFEGSNAVGNVSKTFEMEVEERPLSISFDCNSHRAFTYSVDISAEILYGGKGASHRWFVNGDLKSEDDKFNYSFPVLGAYKVDYVCVNSKGECIEKSWSFDYDEYLADFEYGNYDDLIQIHNSNANYLKSESLSIVDSPYGNDGHGKVLCWHIDSKNKTRGGFILSKDYFTKHGIDISQFKGIKLSGRLAADEKNLSATARRAICLAFESGYSNEYKSLPTIKTGKGDAGLDDPENPGTTFTPWCYVCKPKWINLQYDMDFSGDGTIKIYPACTWNKTTVVSGNYAYVYIDDIILVK